MKKLVIPIPFLIILIALVFLFSNCVADEKVPETKTTTTTDTSVPGITTQTEVAKEYTGLSEEDKEAIRAERAKEKAEEQAKNLPGFRAHAKELVKARAEKEKAMAFLTSDHWAYEFVFDGSQMSKKGVYDGHWIKFGDDHTYQYGVGNDVKGSGQYHYSLDSEKMIMVDDKDDKMPEEWEIKAQDEVMIMVGSGYFGNNPRQSKMLRWNGRPMPTASTI